MKAYFTTENKLNLTNFPGFVYRCNRKLKGFFVVEPNDSGNDLTKALGLALAKPWWDTHGNNDRPLPVETFSTMLLFAIGDDKEAVSFPDAVAVVELLRPPPKVVDELNSSAETQEDNMMSQMGAYCQSMNKE